MTNDRTGVTIVTASTVVAVLAIAAPIIGIGQPIQFVATLGGILLGPGSLAYRLATGSKWSECLMVGVALNFSTLMLLALTAVVLHFWHPMIELIIPAATCLLAILLTRRRTQDDHQRGE
ncbi:hypothetical protein EAS64_07280 [Trebonia kvetii]|uniref:Uncharacterized protein n=1 Tax=Trebonia kvetii TaxID=2480626 RepID=A0A6P2C730_9ACTN|nr:hypothetical protein [Trebonia kvetii]TVZ07108.1 hypothetical protein EAS64_07280 [Trebonia kvetii]